MKGWLAQWICRTCQTVMCYRHLGKPTKTISGTCEKCGTHTALLIEDFKEEVDLEGGPQAPDSLSVQVGGNHYKDLKIQPVEYIHANTIPFMEGSAIKYLTRWRNKGGIADLRKARHFIDMLIDLEQAANPELIERI